jgi:hypothetical protein
MAFRKKATHLLEYEADIYVIQESEETSKLDIAELKSYPIESGSAITIIKAY